MKKYLATNTVIDTFHCPLERAFKTPILGDATKILIGYYNYPIVLGFSKDDSWGIAGGSRVPIYNGALFIKSKERGIDEIFERDENRYWKWGVKDFGGFFSNKAIGEWVCSDNKNGTINVEWKYTWHSTNIFTQPINWLFVKIYWRKVMKNGIKSIKEMAEKGTPYIYN